jgi:hypothetical protein
MHAADIRDAFGSSRVQCKRQVILLEAQIADLPRDNPNDGEGGRVK